MSYFHPAVLAVPVTRPINIIATAVGKTTVTSPPPRVGANNFSVIRIDAAYCPFAVRRSHT